MSDLLAKLSAPFPPNRISWRVGSTAGDKTKGMALAYIDSRDVQDRLDQVCGADGWQCRYPHAGQKTVCEIGVKCGEEWIWKADGAGDSDVEAEKGALSDAFKRAAVKWGIGRYLYDIDSPWVQITQKGRSYVIADHEHARLEKLLPGSKAKTAPDDAPKNTAEHMERVVEKNAPGVTAARKWVADHLADLKNSADGMVFMSNIAVFADKWAKVKDLFPGLWKGPNGSGLYNEARKVATTYQCLPEFDAFVKQLGTEDAE